MARSARITRKTQLVRREEVREQLLKVREAVAKGYNDQVDRADDTLDYWDLVKGKLGSKQFYNGNSKLFVPLIPNAIEARKTRFMNQIFPQAGRYLDVTTEDGEIPHATMALLEMYIERAELRTKVIPPLLVAGDTEGTYAVCVTWSSRKRHTVSRETSPLKIGGIEHPDLGEQERLKEETIEDAGPEVDIIPDPDLLVLPATSDSIDAAIDAGGSVTTLCRWTKVRVQELIDDDELDSEFSAEMLAEMNRGDAGSTRDVPKKLADYAGIRAGGSYAIAYRTWTKIKIGGERRLVLAYFGGDGDELLGCKLCPYWCDKCDIIAGAVRKMPGVFKGPSLVAPCADMQYMANDFVNMGLDTGIFTVQPVVLTDPEKNPKIGTMVLDTMAVWETSPRDTQILQFPPVYQHSFQVVEQAQRFINQTLSVSPAAMAQSASGMKSKPSQAMVAMEQQVDLLTTADAVTITEQVVLTPVVQRFAEYDAQFRDEEILVRSIGELGVKVEMQTVPPLQMGKRWSFKWRGVEAARSAQQIQQQISFANVLVQGSQHPSIAAAGYAVNLVPIYRTAVENIFGPRVAPEVFYKVSDKLSVPAELENSMLMEGFHLPVSPLDDDVAHMKEHVQAVQQTQDMRGKEAGALHIALHQQQMQAKAAAQQAQAQQGAMQGGGGPGGGGGPRPPRQGGQATGPRAGGQQPAGRIHPDQMKGGIVQMPRKTG